MTTEIEASERLPPPLLSGERVLYFKPIIWAGSGKSLPTYRLSLSIPFVQEIGLYITDRRVLSTCWLFWFFRFEWSAWFPGEHNTGDRDYLETVTVGRNALLGSYLELGTWNPVRHWSRSRKARIRLFMKNPEPLRRLISEVLGPTRLYRGD